MRLARIFSTVLLLGASTVSAQVVSATGAVVSPEASVSSRSEGLPVADNTYGTSGLTWVTLTPWDFHPINSTTTYDYVTFPTPTFGIYRTGGTLYFEAGLHLPEGAVVSVIELAACDTNAGFDLSANFRAALKTGADASAPGSASTSGSAGCQVVSSAPFTPWTVNNDTTYYAVQVTFGLETDASLVLNSVRVGYKLQISPDPAGATFADVPHGHPFHRFVEALYASGITGGCGGGNYCPDAPVTRGQMAVFLAGALGLHWAP
jgi:hypothetical protein